MFGGWLLLASKLKTTSKMEGTEIVMTTSFSCKDKLHTALDIFCFVVIFVIEVIEVDELEEITVSTAAQI